VPLAPVNLYAAGTWISAWLPMLALAGPFTQSNWAKKAAASFDGSVDCAWSAARAGTTARQKQAASKNDFIPNMDPFAGVGTRLESVATLLVDLSRTITLIKARNRHASQAVWQLPKGAFRVFW
jgi:hypothetical protein